MKKPAAGSAMRDLVLHINRHGTVLESKGHAEISLIISPDAVMADRNIGDVMK